VTAVLPERARVGTEARVTTLGWGSYLPDRVVTNTEVAEPAGVDAAWVERKTGILLRRRAAAHEASSDLALAASREALRRAGIDAGQLEVIVLATSTPDHPQPPTAALVQHRLGAEHAAAFDLNAVCSGFVFALAVARDMVATRGGHALVIGVDVYSRILDPTDRRTAVLFGDGAGAVVIGSHTEKIAAPRPARGIRAIRLLTAGSAHDLIKVPAGGSRIPPTVESVRAGAHWFTMNGRGVQDYVAETVPRAVGEFLADHDVPADSIRHLVTHQANGRLIGDLVPRLGLPHARFHQTVERYGNTGAASVPITLAEAAPHIEPGEPVLVATFGGGMAIGLTLIDW
jgi:3-oxoacyl-(acyl-carrier-protein) synthase III